jgi:integrase
MARPSKGQAVDYARPQKLSAGLLERVTCPDGRAFVVVRDVDHPGLRLRVTAAGGKYWQFETRIKGKLFTRSLGEWPAVPIGDAQAKARELRTLTAQKIDPRELERQRQAELERQRAEEEAQRQRQQAEAAAAAARAITVGEVWPRYLREGRPVRKDAFKPRYLADLKRMSAPGGEKKKRGHGVTRPGPLFPLMALPLVDINDDVLQVWFEREAQHGKFQASRALMMFRGFIRWCSARVEYRKLIDRQAGKGQAIIEQMPSMKSHIRKDALEAAQVPGWWAGVEQLSNRTVSVYLRALLLTGARREEMASLTWANVDFQWRKLTIADKVDTTRTIPLTPYVAHMLASLPRVGPFVFASAGKAGRITDARKGHQKALQSAGIDWLTIHGLRRSFSLLGEAAGAPAGAIAQVMGHKPSATAEGYRPRSIDALRPFLEQIEQYILQLAGVKFDRNAQPGRLALVAS